MSNTRKARSSRISQFRTETGRAIRRGLFRWAGGIFRKIPDKKMRIFLSDFCAEIGCAGSAGLAQVPDLFAGVIAGPVGGNAKRGAGGRLGRVKLLVAGHGKAR